MQTSQWYCSVEVDSNLSRTHFRGLKTVSLRHSQPSALNEWSCLVLLWWSLQLIKAYAKLSLTGKANLGGAVHTCTILTDS